MSSAKSSAKQGDGAAILIFGGLVLGIAVLGCLFVWVAGVVGGLLGGHGPAIAPLEKVPSILAGLPKHASDPAAAWPPGIRGDLAGPVSMITALILAFAVIIAAVVALLGVAGKISARRHAGDRGAHFAGRGDLRALIVKGPQAGRVILGRHEKRLVAAEPRASTLVVAPSQSGKTTGLAIPAILEWDGPVLATSVKGDLAHDTFNARRAQGEARIFDPTGSTGLPTAVWSPVAAATTWEASRRVAANLLQVGLGGTSPDETFWRPASARYLAPLLLAANQSGGTMGDVLRWITTTTEDEPTELLEACGVPGARTALEQLQSVWEADPKFASSVLQTAATALDPWGEPQIADATTGGGAQITAEWLLAGRNTLYITAPAHDQRRLRGLFTALISEVVAAAFDASTRTGRPIDPALLLMLDEAANVAPLGNLDEIASTGPGQGVQLVTILQNLSQAQERWGKDKAETIIANHRARLFGSGIADRTTLEYLGAVLGEEQIDRVSTTRQRGLLASSGGSKTESQEYRRLAAPNRVREAAQDTALLVYGRLSPAWIALRPWYRDKGLTKLVEDRSYAPVEREAGAAAEAVEPR